MKKIFVFTLCILIHGTALPADPPTVCPSGYIAVTEEYMIISNDSCPSGYTSAGTAYSCLPSAQSESCMMFAPANTTYTDTTGEYVYSEICPLT